MLITLSPAKILDFETPATTQKKSAALFVKEATELNKLLQALSAKDIAVLMKINTSIALQVYEYVQTFEIETTVEKQAAFAFNGIAYQGLDIATLPYQTLDFAQEHLITLSGLYGILRPLDMIKPYRLDMGHSLQSTKSNTLYAYWRTAITAYISQRLLDDDNIWINLASNEYAKVIDKNKLPTGCKIITPQFKELDGNKYKQVVVYSKKARGMMSRFIIENKLKNIEHLKAFDYEGYTFSSQLSNMREWVFIR